MKSLDIVIAIDDLHPEEGWGLPNDECTKYIQLLNEEFGCKFVLFTPSNYQGLYPLSKHKDWVKFWKDKDWIEFAGHGHTHCRPYTNPNYCRENEFLDLDYYESQKRLNDCLIEWDSVDVHPLGWRMCGWNATQGSFYAAQEKFKYLAIHELTNKNIHFREDCKLFANNTCITSKEQSIVDDKFIYFQSHISGKFNKNVWDLSNYTHFKNTLKILLDKYKVTFKNFEDLI